MSSTRSVCRSTVFSWERPDSRNQSRQEELTVADTQLGLAVSRRLIDSGIACATELGVPVSIAVVDAGGHVVIKVRMDNAPLISVRMAEDKAYTSAATNLPTGDLHPLVQPGEPLYGLIAAEGGRIITFRGGIPLRDQTDQIVGGIGVSGGTVDQDDEIASTAVHAGSTSGELLASQ